MTQPDRYEGFYNLMEVTVEVIQKEDRLLVRFPGTPPGFEVRLSPLAEADTFRMDGGPADGATAVFRSDTDGHVNGIVVGGEYELARLAGPPPAPDVPTGQGLLAPTWDLDEGREAAFSALVDEILTQADGRVLAYRLPYPKHEFLQYAAARNVFIFHGSGKPDIDEFTTRRTSMELNDKSGRGNVQGIYGTDDGLWPLFFAVVDREKISGSIRNGFSKFRNEAGEEINIYHFSINREWLDKAPWRTGMLYFLPRATFRRMPATVEGGESNEWVSEVPVRPLARLVIAPEDFLFLHQIGGHDDSEFLRLQALGKEIMTAVTEATFSPDTLTARLDYSAALGTILLEYIPLMQKYVPTARLVLRFEAEGDVWYEFTGPPAVIQVMQNRLTAR